MIIPKKIYDKEYATQWKREVDFLETKDIAYSYASRHPQYNVTRYKYTKTPELFLALAEFYNQVRNERFFKDVEGTTKKILPIEKGCIEIKASDLTEAEKKLITGDEIQKVIQDDTE